MARFRDRTAAGRELARHLEHLRGGSPVVLGLPRGGVPLAAEVAETLGAPLDVIVVRKLGVPARPELAMGAIGEGGTRVLDERTVRQFGVTEEQLARVQEQEWALLHRRATRYREGRERLDLTGRTAILVDDGIATGATARVACRIARQLDAARIVLAVPVAPRGAVARFPEADEVVCLATPSDFRAVGYHYLDFGATQDDEVVVLLHAARRRE